MEINHLFENIVDLPGIEGVCLFDTSGRMYVNRLPTFFSNGLFAEAQRRIVAMYQTMDDNFLPCDDYLLKYSERWLLLRRNEGYVMLVLGGDKANLSSTRMVTNMTMKYITPANLSHLNGPPSATSARVATTPPVPLPTPATTPAPANTSITTAPFLLNLKRFTTALASTQTPPSPAPAAKPVPTPVATAAEPKKTARAYRGQAY